MTWQFQAVCKNWVLWRCGVELVPVCVVWDSEGAGDAWEPSRAHLAPRGPLSSLPVFPGDVTPVCVACWPPCCPCQWWHAQHEQGSVSAQHCGQSHSGVWLLEAEAALCRLHVRTYVLRTSRGTQRSCLLPVCRCGVSCGHNSVKHVLGSGISHLVAMPDRPPEWSSCAKGLCAVHFLDYAVAACRGWPSVVPGTPSASSSGCKRVALAASEGRGFLSTPRGPEAGGPPTCWNCFL